MFRWTEDIAFLNVNAPANIAGSYPVSGASFNPINTSVTDNVVLTQPANGCTSITNGLSINGNIALIDRGDCNFTVKVDNAIAAGAKPGQLMFPLRVALSGKSGGPDLGAILEILGKDECVRRINRLTTLLS